tara:strand:- start:472 stop:966 length:495 start_codon:yes stop_codon:yes gene_type:complete
MIRVCLLTIFFIFPFISFSQGQTNNKEINWISLKKAEKYASKYDSDILVFFFRKGCPDCKKMKEQALKNPEIIQLINENFYPVMIDARTKDTIVYNGKKYTNQQPVTHGSNFRHDLYHELVIGGGHQYYYPYIVIINGKHEIIDYLPGSYPAIRLKRRLMEILN